MKHKRRAKRAATEQVESTKTATTEQLIKCSKCDKKFLDSSGLAGHLWLTHGIRVGIKEELKQLKSKLEAALKENADLKKDSIPKDKLYACPKCNGGFMGYDFKIVS